MGDLMMIDADMCSCGYIYGLCKNVCMVGTVCVHACMVAIPLKVAWPLDYDSMHIIQHTLL